MNKKYQEELMLLRSKEYRNAKERVFDFLNLFKKTNKVKVNDMFVIKKGEAFTYGTKIFTTNDEQAMTCLYCTYREAELKELLANRNKGNNVGQQLSLF